jgi:hypothetical protein
VCVFQPFAQNIPLPFAQNIEGGLAICSFFVCVFQPFAQNIPLGLSTQHTIQCVNTPSLEEGLQVSREVCLCLSLELR